MRNFELDPDGYLRSILRIVRPGVVGAVDRFPAVRMIKKPKPKRKAAKPGPKEEVLRITEEPQTALAKFLKSKPR